MVIGASGVMLAFIGCDDLRTFQVRIIAIFFVGHGESGEIPLFQARCSLRQHLIGDMYVSSVGGSRIMQRVFVRVEDSEVLEQVSGE